MCAFKDVSIDKNNKRFGFKYNFAFVNKDKHIKFDGSINNDFSWNKGIIVSHNSNTICSVFNLKHLLIFLFDDVKNLYKFEYEIKETKWEKINFFPDGIGKLTIFYTDNTKKIIDTVNVTDAYIEIESYEKTIKFNTCEEFITFVTDIKNFNIVNFISYGDEKAKLLLKDFNYGHLNNILKINRIDDNNIIITDKYNYYGIHRSLNSKNNHVHEYIGIIESNIKNGFGILRNIPDNKLIYSGLFNNNYYNFFIHDMYSNIINECGFDYIYDSIINIANILKSNPCYEFQLNKLENKYGNCKNKFYNILLLYISVHSDFLYNKRKQQQNKYVTDDNTNLLYNTLMKYNDGHDNIEIEDPNNLSKESHKFKVGKDIMTNMYFIENLKTYIYYSPTGNINSLIYNSFGDNIYIMDKFTNSYTYVDSENNIIYFSNNTMLQINCNNHVLTINDKQINLQDKYIYGDKYIYYKKGMRIEANIINNKPHGECRIIEYDTCVYDGYIDDDIFTGTLISDQYCQTGKFMIDLFYRILPIGEHKIYNLKEKILFNLNYDTTCYKFNVLKIPIGILNIKYPKLFYLNNYIFSNGKINENGYLDDTCSVFIQPYIFYTTFVNGVMIDTDNCYVYDCYTYYKCSIKNKIITSKKVISKNQIEKKIINDIYSIIKYGNCIFT